MIRHTTAPTSVADIPQGVAPGRYLSPRGYIILEWRLGPYRRLRCYEHQFVLGFPPGQTHHINGLKDDNRPENLRALEPAVHSRIHNRRGFDLDRAVGLYDSGLNLSEVAREIGVLSTSVLRAFQRLGIPTRRVPPKNKKVFDHAVLVTMRRAGMTQKDIGKALGASRVTVGKFLRANADYPLTPQRIA